MRKYKSVLYLSTLVLLGGALRLYRISEQSLWFDEWLIYIALTADSPFAMLCDLFVYFAEMAVTPVYFFFAYCITETVGLSVLFLRLFSIITGLFSIMLLFVLGKRIGGVRTGAVAALCLALSPQHIWHNQEIRPYSLLILFCLIALLALLYWRESGSRRWFLVNYLCNGLLLFTHLFGVLFLIPQGLYLLQRREYKVYARWTCSHLLLVFILLAAVLVKPHVSEGYHARPALSWTALFFRIFPQFMPRSIAGDVISRHHGLNAAFETGTAGADSFVLPQILPFRPWFDQGLLLLILGCVGLFTVYAAYRWFIHAVRCKKMKNSSLFSATLPEQVLLVSLALVPSTILSALTLIFWTNFADYGHDIYNTIAIYIILGLVLSRLPRRLFRPALAVLILLYGYQCLLLLPDSTRTEWRRGAEYVKEYASDEDLVLDLWWIGPASRQEPYFSDSSLTLKRVSTVAGIGDEAARFYIRHQDAGRDQATSRSVWLLAETHLWDLMIRDHELLPLLRQGLEAHGLDCSVTEFPGGLNFVVVHIRPLPSRAPRRPDSPARDLWTVDYDRVLADLGLQDAPSERKEAWLGILQRTVGLWPAINAMGRAAYPLDLLHEGDLDLAEAMARRIVLENPSFGLGYLGLAMVWAAQGDDQRAFAAFNAAFSHHLSLKRFFGDFAESLCQRQDLSAAQDALAPIRKLSVPLFHDTAAHVLALRRETSAGIGADTKQKFIQSHRHADHVPVQQEDLTFQGLDNFPGRDEDLLWIDALFRAQESLSGLTWWLPLYKYLPAAAIDMRLRLTGNTDLAVEQYRRLIRRFPFEKRLYDRCDALLLHLEDPERYEAAWRDWAAYNPEMAPIACRALAHLPAD